MSLAELGPAAEPDNIPTADELVVRARALAPKLRVSIAGKWLELLKQIAPGVTRVAVLRDASQAFATSLFAVMQAVAPSLGVEVIPVPSVGYTVATHGYSFREGQPAGPVIDGHADSIDDLLNDRVSLNTP